MSSTTFLLSVYTNVVFCDHETALKIHQTRTKYKFKGKPIEIRWALLQKKVNFEELNFDIFGLNPDATDESVQVCLGAYAQIKCFYFSRNDSGAFCGVKFVSYQDVKNFYDNISIIKKTIGTDNFNVKRYDKKKEEKEWWGVRVRKIHPDLEANDEFYNYFNSFGDIKSLRLTDTNPKFKTKTLYVQYFDENAAKTLIEEIDGKDVFDCDMPLSASFYQTTEKEPKKKNKTYYE
ncbi:hypothetical protein EIN_040480 [Entamoeba invadens IP1]|uniref:RRM domain-containing protein n=1 Tax=Entamoeba invadens IP1 TaxID=370355 RepID=A0A0A1TWG9_ENTIV|nr:hypothetical protein EIN_040480 [Entamoeba invadens IP1]ELP85484.1 hypothetical protein EIN_040480 [Entamoeba invadens IP1]|eukprot:XP_004184830.1 hypothetical protein EIN_040480 [Entamoeba invadens IP1]